MFRFLLSRDDGLGRKGTRSRATEKGRRWFGEGDEGGRAFLGGAFHGASLFCRVTVDRR